MQAQLLQAQTLPLVPRLQRRQLLRAQGHERSSLPQGCVVEEAVAAGLLWVLRQAVAGEVVGLPP